MPRSQAQAVKLGQPQRSARSCGVIENKKPLLRDDLEFALEKKEPVGFRRYPKKMAPVKTGAQYSMDELYRNCYGTVKDIQGATE
jgi:hypothetical protein